MSHEHHVDVTLLGKVSNAEVLDFCLQKLHEILHLMMSLLTL